MSEKNIYREASRLGLTIKTGKGPLSVDMLWTLPLVSKDASRITLDGLAIQYDKLLSESKPGTFVSSLSDSKKEDNTSEVYKNRIIFDIILDIINYKENEKKEAEDSIAKESKRKLIREIIHAKTVDNLKDLSLDELVKLEQSI